MDDKIMRNEQIPASDEWHDFDKVAPDAVYQYANDTFRTTGNAEASRKTEEEARHCKYCDFKAEDWPMFANHVFGIQHITKTAEAHGLKIMKGSSLIQCEACSVTCNGAASWNTHLLGARHRKALANLAAEKEKSAGGGRMKNKQIGNIQNKPYDRVQKQGKSSNVQVKAIGAQIFASHPQPLIGLEYVTEVQVAGHNPRYECSLCDAKFEHNLKFPHLVGQKHRMNVLKIKRPDFVRELNFTSKKRSKISALLLQQSIELELAEGRKEVKVRVEQPPPSSVSSPGRATNRGAAQSKRGRKKRASNTSMGNSEAPFAQQESNTGSYSPLPGRGGHTMPYESVGHNEMLGHDTFGHGTFDGQHSTSFDNRKLEQNFQKSVGQPCAEAGQAYDGSGEVYPPLPPQCPPRSPDVPSKKGISVDLASAIGELTKLVKDNQDASVALQVSTALAKALLQYKKEDSQNVD